MKKFKLLLVSLTLAFHFLQAQPCGADAGADITICPGSYRQIGSSPEFGMSYSWYPTTGLLNSNTSNPSAAPSTTTTYTVTVSGPGCVTSQDQITVRVAKLDVGMTIEYPDGTSTPWVPYVNEWYFNYEENESIFLHSNAAYDNVWIKVVGDWPNQTYSYGYDQDFEVPFTGPDDFAYGVMLRQHDDQGNTCNAEGGGAIATGFYGWSCDDLSDYPGGFNNLYCASALPATVYATDYSLANTTHWYDFTYGGGSNHYWNFSSISGDHANISPVSSPGLTADHKVYLRSNTSWENGSYPDTYWSITSSVLIFRDAGCKPIAGTIAPEQTPPVYKSHGKPKFTLPPAPAKVPLPGKENTIIKNTANLILTPNPTDQKVKLQSNEIMLEVYVYDAQARIRKYIKTDQSYNVTIPTNELSNGVYFVKIKTKNGFVSKTLIVQK